MARVVSLSKDDGHKFSKVVHDSIRLLEGLGVEGDAHCGTTVKHQSRVQADPTHPNLRQVHLIHLELIQELRNSGFKVGPGIMGENILTEGIDILSLPKNTILNIGTDASIKVTGLRNPCAQLGDYQKGLTSAVLDKDESGALIRKSGIMAIVLKGGIVKKDDLISIELPPEPHQKLEPV